LVSQWRKQENAETEVWLDFSFACKYINDEDYIGLVNKKAEVGRLLGDIIKNPAKYS
jgi:four helix bundle protein